MRKWQNMIHEVRDSNNIIHTTNDEIGQAFVYHYSFIFKSMVSGDDRAIIDALDSVTCTISEDDNILFIAPYIVIDVNSTLDIMYLDKAPGPDGMTVTFYKKNWHLIGGDVTKAVLHVLNNGGFIHEVNATFIALVPQIKNAIFVKDYKPIALSNIVYKIMAKVLAMRLCLVLGSKYGDHQCDFLKGIKFMTILLLLMKLFLHCV